MRHQYTGCVLQWFSLANHFRKPNQTMAELHPEPVTVSNVSLGQDCIWLSIHYPPCLNLRFEAPSHKKQRKRPLFNKSLRILAEQHLHILIKNDMFFLIPYFPRNRMIYPRAQHFWFALVGKIDQGRRQGHVGRPWPCLGGRDERSAERLGGTGRRWITTLGQKVCFFCVQRSSRCWEKTTIVLSCVFLTV